MKYKLLFKPVLCFILITILTLGWLNAQNTGALLVNGDFETGKPEPWTAENNSITNIVIHSGSYALEIKSGGLPISQSIQVKPNSKYKVSGYLKTASGAETVQLGIQIPGGASSATASALTVWAYKELIFTTGPANTSVNIQLYHPKNEADHSAWADDIKVDYMEPFNAEKVNGIKPLEKRIPKTDLGIQQQPDEKLKWLQDAKFGLFIHWGLYSGPAQGEWYMHNKPMSASDYSKLATTESGEEQFTADQYNPELWAQIAKDAGVKYMNLTTMHHDGFALFDSKYPNAFTAKQVLGIDLIKKYVDACRKAGLKVGIYKTLINWRYPGYYDIFGTGKGPFFNANNVWGYQGDPSHLENARIMKEELYAQIKELMTNYGKIDQIFWDGGWLAEKSTDADASFFWESGKYRNSENLWPVNPTYDEIEKSTNKPLGIMGIVRKYQPDILVNPRSGWYGDYMSEEGNAPVSGPVRTKEIWEKCMTLHNGWGYTRSAEDPKLIMKVDALKRMLSDCIIRNMNLLVNIGPDRHGVITQAETKLLKNIGDWIKKVQEAIYGTRGGPWDPKDGQYGYCYKDNTIYVYLYQDYKGDTFTLPSVDIRNGIKAYDVYNKKPLKLTQNKSHQITVTGIDRSEGITIIAIELDRKIL